MELSADLPLYSDCPVEDTEGVWSYDDTRMIVGLCRDDIEIVSRPDIGSPILREVLHE